ncbi:MAG: glycosyltransferase 87 family protein [Elusimicrobiales bacterium]|nr:glycosyltransferase 87 family protein [Elusimicrobiales bacterium]
MFFEGNPADYDVKTRRLNLIALITLAGFVLSFLYYYLRLSPPQPQSFLFPPSDRFGDFSVLLAASAKPYASTASGCNHFPFLLRFCWLFSLLPRMLSRWIWLLSFAGFGLAALYKGFKTGNKISDWTNTLIIFFLSYPVLFAVDRGNFETFVFMCVYLFAVSLYRGKRGLAALFLALAVALKPFPAVFLGLLLAEGEYDCAWRAVLGAALLTFACYLSYSGDVFETIIRHFYILRYYDYWSTYCDVGLAFGHSLFGAAKALLFGIQPALLAQPGFAAAFKPVYGALAFVSGAGLMWFTYRRRATLAFWEKLALYVCAMNLLPFVSSDYKLLHLLLPLVFFVNEPETGRYDVLYAVLFGLLLVPKSFFHYSVHDILFSYREGVVLNPLLMLTLAIAIIHGQFARPACASNGGNADVL